MRSKFLVGAAIAVAVAAATVAVWPGGEARSPAGPAQPETTARAGPEEVAPDETLKPVSTGRRALGLASEAAATETSASKPAPDRDHDLHGRVLDPSGSPVSGAAIEVRRCEAREFAVLDLDYIRKERVVARAKSDSRGEFSVRLPCGRPFDLHVASEGFAPEIARNRYAGEFVEMRLHRGALLCGRLTRAADGTAIAGAKVRGFRLGGGPEGGGELFLGETDGGGNFRFESLAPGEIVVEVVAEKEASPPWERIRLEEGAIVRKDFVLADGITVTGRVVDSTSGRPIEGAEVGESWVFRKVARTDAEGRYVLAGFDVRSARDVHVRASGFGRRGRRVADTAARSIEMNFALLPARLARGRILSPDATPVPAAYVAAVGSEWGGEEDQKIDWQPARVGPDGVFEIRDIRPDIRHVLFARADGFGTVLRGMPDEWPRETVLDIGDVVLPAPATIAGTVVTEGGDGVANVIVVLEGWFDDRLPASQSPDLTLSNYVRRREGRTDDLGRFRFTDLSPGKYDVKPEIRNRPEVKVTTVQVAGGETLEGVRIVVPAGLSIEGRVVGPDGTGLKDAYVRLTREEGTPAETASGRTGPDGLFRIEGVAPGTYTLQAHPFPREGEERFAPAMLKGVAAGSRGITVTLTRTSTISGVVLDAEGSAVAEASVIAQDPDGEFLASATTGAEGRFVLHLREGSTANLKVHRPSLAKGRFLFLVSDPDEPLLTGVAAGTSGLTLQLPRER